MVHIYLTEAEIKEALAKHLITRMEANEFFKIVSYCKKFFERLKPQQ